MASYTITCIHKSSRPEPHERIQFVGVSIGILGSNKLTVDQVLISMAAGNTFWVVVGPQPVQVIRAVHNGHPYIKTKADGLQPNNLLSLPECP